MADRFLQLADDPARDPAVVGGKAAGLARAFAAGFPVLPGWVLPLGESAQVLRTGGSMLRRSGPAAACLAVADHPLDASLMRELGRLAERLGTSAIVRSSTLQDVDPAWAGAFATYADVSSDALPVAIRGCWASALSRDVLARSSAMGVDRGRLRVAVLLQPWVAFEAGGTAEVEPDGGVRVTSAAGPPGRLVAGRTAGAVARVTPAGVEGDPPPNLDPGVVPEIASLARESGGTLEWGYADGRVWLLQVGRAPAAIRPTIRAPRRASWALPPMATRLASLATRYPGPLGDRFVLPWAPALTRVPAPDPFVVRDLRGALSEARELAGVLTTRAWGSPPALAEREAADALRSILGDDPDAGLQRLSRLRPVDPASAARLVGLVHGLGRALAERGILSSAELVWRLSVEELERAVSTGG
ncbi:MAG TPA: PEP/pyruvate-binding domain-containing protein, partial [Actinomycetota bacterium]|nr:PEP/pyruvate-binding domain-containing protein [Actinomycetota bacterium]